ncbi:ECF RNA polymerase sigma-E factor [Granulosicoccus antarcticus IMCC3135]|uniref:RNA polymerase sigma factor n=1 Tax=Granulosicoccus antarcticus IMCC3135 TaxID=1192854 RepID=A0A2Z2NT64_9GAMM|nr:ECF RNA polymerase sigma-E factor [Granulosicoccus antarcticus IMCC3135]
MIRASNKVSASEPLIARGAKPLSDKEIDMALVERVQRGDKSAYDLLVLKYQHKIGHLVSRYVHDAHESQDVTQEAFIKAYRGLKNFRGDSAFYTWLYRIAINTAKNHLVTMSRKISDTGIDAADAEQFDSGSALRDNATPERVMVTEQIARVVSDSIEALPDDLRTAIRLREFEGMSYEDIAQAMDCPIGTVRSRIFRAREAIDINLEPLLEERRR